MRNILIAVVILFGSLRAVANSTSPVAGYLTWNSTSTTADWTPHILSLAHPGGDPNMWPGTFSTSSLSVTCIPACAIGDKFSVNLSMSNFSSGLGYLIGTINLVSAPIVIGSQNGTGIAHFNLTGTLCASPTCSSAYLVLNVNVHGFADLAYTLNSGQLAVSSVSYVLPEPSSLALLGTGIVFALGRFRLAKRFR